MSRIAPLDPSQASASVQATLAGLKAKIGGLPNLVRTLAHSPTALHGYLGFNSPEAQGHLSVSERELVALAVGQANGCAYCLAAHTLIGRGAGLSDAQIQAARSGTGLAPREDALARFAVAVVQTRGWVENADYEAFLSAGFAPGVAIEVVALVALNTLTNYVNHLAGTEIDFPKVDVDLVSAAA